MDVRARSPAEPEQTDGEEDGGGDHGEQAFLGREAAVLLKLAGESGLSDDDDEGDADEDADQDAEEGQGGDTGVCPVADFHEGDGVGFEEEVEDAVDEAHVDGEEEEDGLEHEHGEGAEEVFEDEVFEGWGAFVELRMEGPVAGFFAESLCAALEEDWGVTLAAYQQCDEAEE